MAASARSGKTGKRKPHKKQTITFNLRKEEAVVFRAYAKSQGKTVRGLLVEFIRACNRSFPGADAILQDPAAEQMSFDDFEEESPSEAL